MTRFLKSVKVVPFLYKYIYGMIGLNEEACGSAEGKYYGFSLIMSWLI